MHVMVAIRQQSVTYWGEHSRLVAAEVIRKNKGESGPGLLLVFVVPMWVVPALAILNLFDGQAKQEQVLLPCFLRHFDSRAVQSADRQSSIHHELHVAGSAGLVACGRNLVGDIARRDQPLSQRNVVL